MARLEQNAPNPFNNATLIRYNIPADVQNAQITITDIKGTTLKAIPLNNKGTGQVSIAAGTLMSGTYIYSLVVDGKKIDSKQMVLTK